MHRPMKRCLVIVAMLVPPCAANSADETSAPAPAPAAVPAGVYTLDKAHASLVFHVDHLGFSHYTAQFKSFDATLQFDPAQLGASGVEVSIDPRSLELPTPPAGFVDSLLGKDWLNAAAFPTMTFKSTRVQPTGANTVHITGDMTLHGVTHPVALDAVYNGGYPGHPMDPHARIGFSAHGTLKRSDFGIAYGIPAPGTTMGVGDAVDFDIEAEFSGPPFHPSQAAE